jgi:hypothetical protein
VASAVRSCARSRCASRASNGTAKCRRPRASEHVEHPANRASRGVPAGARLPPTLRQRSGTERFLPLLSCLTTPSRPRRRFRRRRAARRAALRTAAGALKAVTDPRGSSAHSPRTRLRRNAPAPRPREGGGTPRTLRHPRSAGRVSRDPPAPRARSRTRTTRTLRRLSCLTTGGPRTCVSAARRGCSLAAFFFVGLGG